MDNIIYCAVVIFVYYLCFVEVVLRCIWAVSYIMGFSYGREGGGGFVLF